MSEKSAAFMGIDICGFVLLVSLFKYKSRRKYKNGCLIPFLNNDFYFACPCCAERV